MVSFCFIMLNCDIWSCDSIVCDSIVWLWLMCDTKLYHIIVYNIILNTNPKSNNKIKIKINEK